jgi:hypothetical protein
MIHGFDNDKFYIDFVSCARPHGNMREESDRRARQIAEQNPKCILSFSGGIDSQSVLHSFYTQGLPIETAFMYCPGYNDNEYEQVKILDKKYGIVTQVIDIDPMACRDEIEELSVTLDIPGKNHLLQRKFLSYLPDDYTFIQIVHDPFVYINPVSRNKYYCQGYYWPEVARQVALDSLGRKGRNILYGDTPEFLSSILNDDIFKSAMTASKYFDDNGAAIEGKDLQGVDRWDFYIKPLLYGKYWKDELIYFTKYRGFELIPYLNDKTPKIKKNMIAYPYEEFVSFLTTEGAVINRVYENVPYDGNN